MSDVFNVYYCDSLLVDDAILKEYAATLQKFIQNPSAKGLDVEQLGDTNVFSIRHNQKIRLFWTITEDFGGRHIVIIKDMKTHAHHRESLLKKGGFERFYVKNENELAQTTQAEVGESPTHYFKITPEKAEQVLASVMTPSRDAEQSRLMFPRINFHKARYLKQRFIEFNESQESSQTLALPILVNGIAGSGKTVVSLMKLKQFLLSLIDSPSKQTLFFITPALQLKQELFDTFQEMLLAEGCDITFSSDACSLGYGIHDVLFQTIDEFSCRVLTQDSTSQYMPKEDVFTFLETQLKNHWRTHSGEEQSVLTANVLYQEIGILQGIKGNTLTKRLQKYQSLGERQSLCASIADKALVIELTQRLEGYLGQNHITHVGFNVPNSVANVTIFADEAQLLSLSELKLLERYSNKQVFLCMDTNQAIFSNISMRKLYSERCNDLNITLNTVSLPFSYRNAIDVTYAANQLLLLKSHVCGSGDKLESRSIESKNSAQGGVEWLDSEWKSQHAGYYASLKQSHEFAVVILDERDRINAKAQYPKDRIFLAKEIQGLEYEHVVLFNPFSRHLSQYIMDNHLSVEALKSGHRATPLKRTNGELNLELKRLLVAMTRAKNTLYIDSKHVSAQTFLQTLLLPERKVVSAQKGIVESTPQDWLNEAKTLITKNCLEQARFIFVERLQLSSEEFDLFLKEKNTPLSSYGKITPLIALDTVKSKDEKPTPTPVPTSALAPALNVSLKVVTTRNEDVEDSLFFSKKTNKKSKQRSHNKTEVTSSNKTSATNDILLKDTIDAFSGMTLGEQMQAFSLLSNECKCNESFMLEMLRNQNITPMIYLKLPDSMQKSMAVSITVMVRCPALYGKMPESIRADEAIAEHVLPREGRQLAYASNELKSSPIHVFSAQLTYPLAFKHAISCDEVLLEEYAKVSRIENKEVRAVYINFFKDKYYYIQQLHALDRTEKIQEYIHRKKDEDLDEQRFNLIVMTLINHDADLAYELFKENLFVDKTLALFIIIFKPEFFSKLPRKFQTDTIIKSVASSNTLTDKFQLALSHSGCFILFAPRSFLVDKMAIIVAMVTWPQAVYYADLAISDQLQSFISIDRNELIDFIINSVNECLGAEREPGALADTDSRNAQEESSRFLGR